jgi:cytochrome b6
VYYRPGAEAFASVRQITYVMHFCWLIWSVHSWCANLFIFSILVHMFSVYFMKAYRSPREFGWWSGLLLLILTLVLGFSGYLLPMNELAYFATKVGLEIPTQMPIIGAKLADLVRAGPDVNEYTVQRFFALHVVVLPALFIGVLTFHLWLVMKHGNAVPPGEAERPAAERRNIPFFPNFLMKDLAMWLVALNVLTILAALFPWSLGNEADALKSAPPGIHPEWYFMSSFQTLKLFGQWLPGRFGESAGIVIFNLGFVLWALVPVYDGASVGGRRARRATYFGLLALGVLVVTTLWGYWGLQ